MMMRAIFTGVAVLLVSLAAASCTGDGEQVDLTAGEITDAQLAGMMLSLEDLGPDFAGFQLDTDSGPLTSDEVAGSAVDPLHFGWASGYQRLYVDVPPAQNPPGIYVVSSTVFLFDTAEGAADYFERSTEEDTDSADTSEDGLTLEEMRQFEATVADEAAGFHSRGRFETGDGASSRLYMSGVGFRRGRLVATAGLLSLADLEDDEQLKSLARTLDELIVEVLQAQAQRKANGEEQPEPLVMRPGAVFATSAERFTQQVETVQGTFDMNMTMGDLRLGAKGKFACRSPDAMYMAMDVMGQTVEMLVAGPDMYMRLPGEGWYVMTAESMGINREVFQEYVQSRGPADYWSVTQQLDGLTRLPDDVLDGVTYLHYEGTRDLFEALEDVPEGLYDPGVLEQIEGTFPPAGAELWLDRETYLPHRMDVQMTFDFEGTNFSIDMSTEYCGYNEPVNIPEPPIDAKPFDLGG